MSFRKPTPQTPPSPAGGREKKPVLIYLLVLFLAAFLLIAASFLSHRSRSEAASRDLRDSVSVQEEAHRPQGQSLSLICPGSAHAGGGSGGAFPPPEALAI